MQEKKYISKIINQNKNYKKVTKQDQKNYKNSKVCHICEKDFNNDKVWDHCHITGKFRGAAHDNCNKKYVIPKYIPIVFHNLRGYDSHFIDQNLGKYEEKIDIIPNNTEKYISISIGNSRNKQVYLRFIDSLQFMSDSLESLVKNINNIYHLKSDIINENINLLKQKGIYPYDYMNSWDKFNETKLPPKSLFLGKLNNEHISDKDYEHAKNIWSKFKINNLGDYHDLYLKTDVLLLADVFENFRKICLNYYKLDAAHYFSAQGLAWDTALKKSRVTLELFTDPDLYLFAEKGIRGGISVISNRYSKANNKYMGQKYNKNKK